LKRGIGEAAGLAAAPGKRSGGMVSGGDPTLVKGGPSQASSQRSGREPVFTSFKPKSREDDNAKIHRPDP
jgi:hypothetical protein